MIKRKKKLIIIQSILFFIGVSTIIYTYYFKENNKSYSIISLENQKKIDMQLNKQKDIANDVFYNIKYTGIDLAGNRYILLAKEAVNNKDKPELVDMKYVEVIFYFKDGTTLNVKSEYGIYNNSTLDMLFKKNIKATYEDSRLTAEKADYSNLNSFLTITDNVVVYDKRGIINADKLLFDIKKQDLNIISLNDNKINANINIR